MSLRLTSGWFESACVIACVVLQSLELFSSSYSFVLRFFLMCYYCISSGDAWCMSDGDEVGSECIFLAGSVSSGTLWDGLGVGF